MNLVDDPRIRATSIPHTTSRTDHRSDGSRTPIERLRQRLIFHASGFQHISPLPTRTSMTVLEVLSKVIRAEELLGLVALAKFMHLAEMFGSSLPICRSGELFTAIATDISSCRVDR
jgi:hypothetical protein